MKRDSAVVGLRREDDGTKADTWQGERVRETRNVREMEREMHVCFGNGAFWQWHIYSGVD